MKRQPYIYFLQHLPTGKYYVGANGSRESHPNNLLQTYFTGSATVKYLMEKDGIESFKIIHIIPCESIEECHQWEYWFLKNIDPARNDEWLNVKAVSPNCYPKPGPTHPRYGIPPTPEKLASLREMFTGKSKPYKQACKMSEVSRGRPKSESHRQAMSIAQKGKPRVTVLGWIITRPDTTSVYVHSLAKYCREHGLSQGSMSLVASGKCLSHRGHKCIRVTPVLRPVSD